MDVESSRSSARTLNSSRSSPDLRSEVQQKARFNTPASRPVGCLRCAGCGSVVTGEHATVEGKTFHFDCFQCSRCRGVIKGNYFPDRGRFSCERCYKEQVPKCVGCGRAIRGQGVTVGSAVYHKACFECSSCRKPIDGAYFLHQGQFFCQPCNEKKAPSCAKCRKKIYGKYFTLGEKIFHHECFTCDICGTITEGRFFTDNDGRHLCEPCNKNQAPRCATCRRGIYMNGVSVNGQMYHPECFQCSNCGQVIVGSYSLEGNNTICEPCSSRSYPRQVCVKCRREIRTQAIIAEGDQPYHRECFACYNCRRSIEGPYITTEEGFLCEICQPRCSICEGPLSGSPSLVISGKHIHSACFRCAECGCNIADNSFNAGRGRYHCIPCHIRFVKDTEEKKLANSITAEKTLKRRNSKRYTLFWRPELVPDSRVALEAMGLRRLQLPKDGNVCICLSAHSGDVGFAHVGEVCLTADESPIVNISYLACALKVLKEHGREPRFSLDPKDPHRIAGELQVKRFFPEWLAGSVVGEVLFQADYVLKELCLGDKSVADIPNVFDDMNTTPDPNQDKCAARQWFVIKRASCTISADGVIIPKVEMSVEARRLVPCDTGYQDAANSDHNDPFVRQAAIVSGKFEELAGRLPAVAELLAFSKALVVALFLLNRPGIYHNKTVVDKYKLPSVPEADGYSLEIPTLARERLTSQVDLDPVDCRVVVGHSRRAMHGGVDLAVPNKRIHSRSIPMRLLDGNARPYPLPLFCGSYAPPAA